MLLRFLLLGKIFGNFDFLLFDFAYCDKAVWGFRDSGACSDRARGLCGLSLTFLRFLRQFSFSRGCRDRSHSGRVTRLRLLLGNNGLHVICHCGPVASWVAGTLNVLLKVRVPERYLLFRREIRFEHNWLKSDRLRRIADLREGVRQWRTFGVS